LFSSKAAKPEASELEVLLSRFRMDDIWFRTPAVKFSKELLLKMCSDEWITSSRTRLVLSIVIRSLYARSDAVMVV